MKGLANAKKGQEEEKDGKKEVKKAVELNLDNMNELYENYIKKEEYLTGVLNTKSLSSKN